MEFPTALTTGPQNIASYTLAGPGGVDKGRNWVWNKEGWARVTGSGTISGVYFPGTVSIEAADVTLKNCVIEAAEAVNFAVVIRSSGAKIKNCRVSGADAGGNRASYGIYDTSGSSPIVDSCDVFYAKQPINMGDCTIKNSYIHDLGYIDGDHNEPIFLASPESAVIENNTLLNSIGQTAVIDVGGDVSGLVIKGNLVAGGNYTFYFPDGSKNITVANNAFSCVYFPKSAVYGPVVGWPESDSGSSWSGNYYSETGDPVKIT
jgi:Right handed beta helix region